MRWLLTLLALMLLPFAAQAQDDRGYLTALLEDNLSGAGRQVIITGFAGALSSRATIEELTIADATGVWLTLRGVSLDWSRAALLRGQVLVNELTAEEIIVARAPDGGEEGLPSPEARGFALPDLPVSVDIGQIAAERVVLGETLLGQPVEGRVTAAMQLSGGEGTATLTLERTDDGPEGRFVLNAGYANETRQLVLDLEAAEGVGGLATTLLGLPGAPAVALTLKGDGPLESFAANIALASNGTDRLAGTVTLTGDGAGALGFRADIGGNMAPLFLPEYATFFGPDVTLAVAGSRAADGALDLQTLRLATRAMQLQGALRLASDGLPQSFALTGTLGLAEGGEVLLPLTTDVETRVQSADLALDFDASKGDAWQGSVAVLGLNRADFSADVVQIEAAGRITRSPMMAVTAALEFAASGLVPADPATAQALGDAITGKANLGWQQGQGTVDLSDLTLLGSGYGLTADARIDGLSSGLAVTGTAQARFDDLSRASGLAGRALAGKGQIDLSGKAALLAGSFDIETVISGTDLSFSQPELDRLLQGTSRIAASILRDTQGTLLRSLNITAASLTATGSGRIASDGSDVTADLAFADLSVLGAAYRGSLTGQARFIGTPEAGTVTLDARGDGLAMGQPQVDALLRGPSQVVLEAAIADGTVDLRSLVVTAATLKANARGALAPSGSDVTADLAFSDLAALGGGYRGALSGQARFVGTPEDGSLTLNATGTGLAVGQAQADRLLRGESRLAVAVDIADGRIRIRNASLANPALTAEVQGIVSGDRREVTLSARLADLGLVLEDFPGVLTVTGTAVEDAQGYQVDLRGTGPGQIAATVAGRVSQDLAQADLAIQGTAQAALANAFIEPRAVSGPLRFDLRLDGPLALASLSGPVTLSGGRVTDAGRNIALERVEARADLAGGRAQISATSAVDAGGGLDMAGSIGLTAPYDADLTVTLGRAVLKDPALFETLANGAVTLRGALAGGAVIAGQITLTETELRIPSTGLGGVGALPGLDHVGEPAAVRATRVRAGLLGENGEQTGSVSRRPYPLNLVILAPNRVFIRGRGLDAELGGELRLGGTTAAVVPSGAFDLIRGRLDILGKRLDLTQARLQLEGDFVPYVQIAASNESDGITSSVLLTGPANEPVVSFASSPPLPEEEVLARLLFGRALNSLSPFQAAQLAGAVANLAGRGGEGIVGKLRQGFGLDDLDLMTDENGGASVRAGRYLSKNLYTEIIVDQQGKSEINLNLDVTRSVTVRGSAGSDGNTGIGVYLEKNY
ncbi:translocation/assembly module TamB domain-containing protein [Paracoccaceae bacterium Fryx2]|nr:translocation/assembly module TamB domain-containing protein [Paracoccaceae bacterium Fryx2]